MKANKEIDREVGWSVMLSVLLIVAGMLAIVVPRVTSLAMTVLVGWLLVLCGALHLAFGWQRRHGGGLRWEIFLGMGYMAAGSCILWHPLLGLESLTLVLAAYLVLEVALEVALYYELRRASGSGWLPFDGTVYVGCGGHGLVGLAIQQSVGHGHPGGHEIEIEAQPRAGSSSKCHGGQKLLSFGRYQHWGINE